MIQLLKKLNIYAVYYTHSIMTCIYNVYIYIIKYNINNNNKQ